MAGEQHSGRPTACMGGPQRNTCGLLRAIPAVASPQLFIETSKRQSPRVLAPFKHASCFMLEPRQRNVALLPAAWPGNPTSLPEGVHFVSFLESVARDSAAPRRTAYCFHVQNSQSHDVPLLAGL
ncbi:hypothetical protein ACCO45_007041 [Purpureocillium lilacinum]|uniref:Uncharacterized protein n=1 Tax=Purpureocillium lilacinum TaxID=33203 RepID=A0ACC4DRB8_PURLI